MIVSVDEAVRVLADAQVLAYPTETVYGLGADPRSPAALERLRALKGLGEQRGVSLLVADLAALQALAPDLPERARSLAERFWPGPLTLVVRVADASLGSVATARGVGFRCSPHPTAAALACAFAGPIVSTSCNRSGEPPCRDVCAVERAFGAGLPVAGGEPCGDGPPSTVVAVAPDGSLEFLREGALAVATLEEVSA